MADVLGVGALVGRIVRLHGIELGRVVDVILDEPVRRAIGFETLCGDGVRRLLPFAGAEVTADAVEAASSLVLVDDLAFYRSRGHGCVELWGSVVQRNGVPVGALVDLVLAGDGGVDELVVATADGRSGVPADDDVTIDRSDRRSAA